MARNTITEPTDDLFDDATGGGDYITIEDVDGRALVIYALERGTAKGDNGDPYEYVQCDVIPLDGKVTEKVDRLGVSYELRFTSGNIVGQLKRKVGSPRPTLGRINSRPGKFKKLAYGMAPVEDNETRKLAARAVEAYNTKQNEDDDDPFSG